MHPPFVSDFDPEQNDALEVHPLATFKQRFHKVWYCHCKCCTGNALPPEPHTKVITHRSRLESRRMRITTVAIMRVVVIDGFAVVNVQGSIDYMHSRDQCTD